MIHDDEVIDLIRQAGRRAPAPTVDVAAIKRRARRRTARHWAAAGTAVVAVAAALAVPLLGARPGNSTVAASRSSSRSAPPLGSAPGCAPEFDVTPTGGAYQEQAVLARARPGQPVTITVTMRVQEPAQIRLLDLLVDPRVVGAGPHEREGALRDVHLYSGRAQPGLKLTATVRIQARGRYPVEAYSISRQIHPCRAGFGGWMGEGQPIGYIVIR